MRKVRAIEKGDRFGEWTMLAPRDGGADFIEASCSCGTIRIVRVDHLLGGRSTSCGHPSGRGMDEAARFRSHTERNADGCLVWNGYLNPKGYGSFKLTGRGTTPAHRWAYERAHGPVPRGMEVDHLCRNRACVEPAHLEAVPHLINVRRSARATPELRSQLRLVG